MKRFLSTWILPALRADPKVTPQTFVLWEPCSRSHGEVVPGYTKYLLDLGYEVLVLMTPARLDEGLFSRFADSRIRHGMLSQRRIRRLARSGAFRKAAGVMVTTAGKLPVMEDGRLDLRKVFGSPAPAPLLLVEHDAGSRILKGTAEARSITLRDIGTGAGGAAVVNPHYFGTTATTPRSDATTVFLMVGAVRSKRRNQNMVYDAARRLIDEGHGAFVIRMIGKPGSEPVPAELQGHIEVLGRRTFAEMYDEVERADFILTAFQRDNPDHAFYRTTGTSGSYQLAYGFAKPCIVQAAFAENTALDAGNSLLYDADEDIVAAMRDAIGLSAEGYAVLQAGMQRSAAALHERSLGNLERLIHG